jgi:hypothetical protein|uniref:Uncharacterized protein n=1 Tax=viral metagenome TaxID=1070528 RepID=A0A6C0ILJ6_9ZZZZ
MFLSANLFKKSLTGGLDDGKKGVSSYCDHFSYILFCFLSDVVFLDEIGIDADGCRLQKLRGLETNSRCNIYII